jgi:tRNA(Ile)-lysidine synthase
MPGGPTDEVAAELADIALRRCTFPPTGTSVDAAVSGGADSVALLILACRAGCVVTAHHVDHGLRPGSAGEADFVASLAGRFGADFQALRVSVEPGPNLEARLREARRLVLPAGAFTGHTADDQAETMLINLLRGAGLDGLGGMRPLHHPIINLRRADTLRLCSTFGIEPFHDPTNDDRRFTRNRIRHDLLPMLNAIAERDVVPILARQSELLHDDADMLDGAAASIDPTDARAITNAPQALRRRALRRWLAEPYPPSADEIGRILQVAAGQATACELSGGRRIARTKQRLRLE